MTDTLQVTQLHYRRGLRPLIHDLSFQLQAGHWLQLQGPNGSGKTTLLRLLAGLLQADSGRITWNGRSIQSQRIPYQADLHYLGHINGLKAELTAIENLCWSAAIQGIPITPATAHQILHTFGLHQQATRPSYTLSQGQQRRVALARLGYSQAKLWLLDEPFNALDAAATAQLQQHLTQHLTQGGLLLLSTHQPVDLPHTRQQQLTLGPAIFDA